MSIVLQTSAAEHPLWELGVGLSPSSFPAYRGSDDRKEYLLPFPYLVYRGDILKVDRRGARALLFNTDRAKLSLSLNASIPVKSKDTDARDGMPDLDPTFEIGPLLNIRMVGESNGSKLSLRLPLRAVLATDFSDIEHVGWVFHPKLNLDLKPYHDWNFGFSIGPQFADRSYHEYYYGVENRFANAKRPSYRAQGGYSGFATILSFSRRFSRFWIGGFLRYDYLEGASFTDSPLVDTNHSLMGGLAAAWIFAKSSTLVSVEDD